MEQAVERVVAVMRNRYHERLYVPELAAEEYFSSFHFTRIFRRDTGVSPSQYLTAVRLFEAKRLLLSTSFSVADIACRVGYSAIGTFTTRFTRLVGLSPGQYRQLPRDQMLCLTEDVRRLPALLPDRLPEPRTGRRATIVVSVHFGQIRTADRLLVGVFDDPIPQGPPLAWAVPSGQDGQSVRFDGLPEGRWVVIAVAESDSSIVFDMGAPVEASAGTVTTTDLELHRPRRTDPPILVPLCNRPPTTHRMVA
jgi:AraC-like DNA-binding protein